MSVKGKKVELPELFYDLVFVYAISNMTKLIHHLHHGIVEPLSFLVFMICLVILINTWMTQTVFINRYGTNSLVDIVFLTIDMSLLIYLSNVFSLGSWSNMIKPFCLAAGSISFTLMSQYVIKYFSLKKEEDRAVCLRFSIILAIRTLFLLGSLLFSGYTASFIAITGVVLAWIMPMFITKTMSKVPIDFAHLAERISLIVIITFGETIIGVAPYFKIESININSFAIFLIVASLFFFYAFEFTKLLDHHKGNQTGVKMIYLHYLIFIGLSLITVSLGFFAEEDANRFFVIGILYLGLLLFYIGTLLHSSYNKKEYRFTNKFLTKQGLIYLLSLIITLVFSANLSIIIFSVVALTLFSLFNLVRYRKN